MLSHLSLHNSGKSFFNTANDSGICAQTSDSSTGTVLALLMISVLHIA